MQDKLFNTTAKKYIERGKYNEIHSYDIGEKTVISGWIFIGNNVRIGKNCRISNYVNIDSGCMIGDRVNLQVYVVLNSDTIVGNDVMIGGHVTTIDEKYMSLATDSITRKPCRIGNNVLIGAGSKLVSVDIGSNSIIGTGSLVLQDVPENQVWIGHPAKPLVSKQTRQPMTREEFELKSKAYLDELLKRQQ